LGLGELDIGKLNLAALKIKDDQPVFKKPLNFILEERELIECKGLGPILTSFLVSRI
jgi:hypothetical protein